MDFTNDIQYRLWCRLYEWHVFIFFSLTIIPLIYTMKKYFINKINCNLLIKIFLQCFCLYLLIFRQGSVFNGVLLWTRHYFSLWVGKAHICFVGNARRHLMSAEINSLFMMSSTIGIVLAKMGREALLTIYKQAQSLCNTTY
jgi:hypothetical protein